MSILENKCTAVKDQKGNYYIIYQTDSPDSQTKRYLRQEIEALGIGPNYHLVRGPIPGYRRGIIIMVPQDQVNTRLENIFTDTPVKAAFNEHLIKTMQGYESPTERWHPLRHP